MKIFDKVFDKIYDKVFGKLDGPPYAGTAGPPLSGLLAYYDGTRYLDILEDTAYKKSTVGTSYGTPLKAQSFTFDGTAYLAHAGILATDTVTNSGDATLSTDTGKLEGTAGEAWDITITSSGAVDKYWISGCNCVGASIPMLDLVNGGVVYATLTSGTLPDFYSDDHQDGLTGFNPNVLGYSVADSHGTLTDGCIIPANPSNPSLDILGNTLQYPRPRLNAQYTGYTGTWDGTAYGVLDETVTMSGDFSLEVRGKKGANTAFGAILGNAADTSSFYHYNSTGSYDLAIQTSGAVNRFTTVETTDDEDFVITFSRVGDSGTMTYSTDSSVDTATQTVSENDFVTEQLFASAGANYQWIGNIEYIKIYNSSDTLIHHWVCESDPLSEQDKIYDVVGGNHATLTGATLPFFTTASEYASYLAENGWTEGEVDPDTINDNSDFSSWTGDDPDGWVISTSEDASSYVTEHPNGAEFVGDGSVQLAWTNDGPAGGGIFENGKTYQVVFKFYSWTVGHLIWYDPEATAIEVIQPQVGTLSFTKTVTASADSDLVIWISNAGTESGYVVEYITVQELPTGYIPAKSTGSVSALDQGLTAYPSALRTIEPGYIKLPQDASLINADIVSQGSNDPINFFFDYDGDQRKIFYDGTTLTSTGYGSDIDKVVMSSADIVDVFVYDTSNDSDGGAWVDGSIAKTTSWYNETLNTATRGSTRPFPSVALIVAESDTVTIYDLTDPDVPMWMVFLNSSTGDIIVTGTVSAIHALNGILSIVQNGVTGGLSRVNFNSDTTKYYYNTGYLTYLSGVSNRNSDSGWSSVTGTGIVQRTINDVAMTVLDDAPLDGTTGLPVPTIAVATDGGVSVIDGPAGVGTVVDITGIDGGNECIYCDIDDAKDLWFYNTYSQSTGANTIPSSDQSLASMRLFFRHRYYRTTAVDAPNTLGLAKFIAGSVALGSTTGITFLKEDTTTPTNGMVAYVNTDYNTGYMHGDIKLATLADTTAETVGVDISTELVTNGGFDTDSDWTTTGGGNSITGGKLVFSGQAVDYRLQSSVLEVGKRYYFTYTISSRTAGSVTIYDGATANRSEYETTDGTYHRAFTALATSVGFYTPDSFDGSIDNVSVKRVQNLVENGEFSSDRIWTKGATWSIGSGVATATDGTALYLDQTVNLIVGGKYAITYEVTGYSSGTLYLFCGDSAYSTGKTADGVYTDVLTASTGGRIRFQVQDTGTLSIDNVEVYLLDTPDRSVNDNPLRVVGELTKTAVATGAELVSWSGFSATDYLEQPYNSDLDFGTGDFYVMWWLYKGGTSSGIKVLYDRRTGSNVGSAVYMNDMIPYFIGAGSSSMGAQASISVGYNFCALTRVSGEMTWYINGAAARTATVAGDVDVVTPMRIGRANDFDAADYPLTDFYLWLFRIGAGAPSATQILEIYNAELPLFQANADCTLAGTSDSVQALAYDDSDERLYASTADGTSVFEGLERIDYIDQSGTPTSDDHVAVSANSGIYAIGTAAEVVGETDEFPFSTYQTGSNINDQYFISSTKGVAVYEEPQDSATVTKINTAMEIE